MPDAPIDALSPERLLRIATGCWPAKCVLAGNTLGLFTLLGRKGALRAAEICAELELHQRGMADWLDTLTALEVLRRDGDGSEARYRNAPEAALFLDAASPASVGGFLSMFNDRIYGMWDDLEQALRTGEPQNESKRSGRVVFDELYRDPDRLRQFLHAMKSLHAEPTRAFVRRFDFAPYTSLCDVGGALGVLAIECARAHPQLRVETFDLPVVEPLAREEIAAAGMEDRVRAVSGDFFSDPLPRADVVTMGQILHDWNLEKKRHLIAAAYDALPPGGAFVALESLIDDARRENVFGLLMSLHMMMEFGDAFDFTFAEFETWCREAGFVRCERIHLAGPMYAGIAYK